MMVTFTEGYRLSHEERMRQGQIDHESRMKKIDEDHQAWMKDFKKRSRRELVITFFLVFVVTSVLIQVIWRLPPPPAQQPQVINIDVQPDGTATVRK